MNSRFLPRRTNLILLLRRPGSVFCAYRAPLFFLCLAALADGITTLANMRLYGIETELHPVQRLFSQILGVNAGVPLAKATQLAFVILVACWWRPWCNWLLWGCASLYAFATMSNHFLWL